MNMRGQVVIKHYTGGSWIDSTNGILDIQISRGISDYVGCWSQVEPGQLTVRSRDLSLSTLALQTRIRIEIDGVAIFTGKTYDVNTEYFPREDSIVTITAFDELAALSLKKYRHATIIGQDYVDRELAEFGNFPRLMQGYNNYQGYNYGSDGTWREGSSPYYTLQNTNYGQSGFNPAAPAPGASSDSTWGPYLDSASWDVDGLIISNASYYVDNVGSVITYGRGFGRGVRQGWNASSNAMIGMPTPSYWTGIGRNTSDSDPNFGYWSSSSYVNDTGHPLYQDTGFWKQYYKTGGTQAQTAKTHYAALMTTNDTDMLSLFLKSEQSEAGFAFVDTKNRFRIYSRAVVDNDPHLSKATFASDGSGISYNQIKVTNGWESVIQGVTVRNTWANDFINAYDLNPYSYNWSSSPDFTLPGLTNRDGTTGTKILNYNQYNTPNYPKDYDWLGYNVTESKQYYVKYAKTLNNQTPIWNVKTRNYDLNALTTIDYFAGKTGLGTKQLTLNTNYAYEINTGAGYMWNKNGTTYAFNRANDTDVLDYNVTERSAELADYILTNYASPVRDVRSIDFSVHPTDLDTIKDIDIYDRITLNHNDSGLLVNKQYCVMGINHYITPNSWDVSYQLWNQEGRP